MSDVSISKVYQFLSNYNKSGDWSKTADKNDNGIISELEAWTFLDNNFFKSEGFSDKEKDDIFYKFWKSMDTDTEGKVRAGSKVNDKGALNDEEINNVQKNIQIAERVDNFVNNNIRGKEPSVISNKTDWLNSVKDGILEKAFDYVTQNKKADITDTKLREFYELTYRKATAKYYADELTGKIAKELGLVENKDGKEETLYKSGSDKDLEKIINSYIQSLNGDTSTSLETIIAKVKELVEAYKDTADTNSKTNVLQPYGYNSDGALNDLQKATVTKTMFDAITKYLAANNSDYAEFKESTDAAIKEFISSYLEGKKASDFVSLNKFDINEFIKTDDYQALLTFIQEARTAKNAATRAAQQEENRKLYGQLAEDIENISSDTSIMNLIYNNKDRIHTEFGIDRNGNIVFEQQDTSNVYDKLKTNIIYELKQRHSAEFAKIGSANIEKLIQTAWIMTYNDFNSSQSNLTKSFIDKVMENLKNILSKVVENPEYTVVFTKNLAYGNTTLTSGIPHYGKIDGDGDDGYWEYTGSSNVNSDGLPSWDDTVDAAEYKETMDALLANIKKTEPYSGFDPDIIEKVFREAQEKAISTCQNNIQDCPYGTTYGEDMYRISPPHGSEGYIVSSHDMVATANEDWSGTSRDSDHGDITPKAIVELTLYYFDKLLYKKLLG